MSEPTNLLFVLAESHCQKALGCYGHPLVKTPNLDRLADRGVRFTDAYCASPLCMPARASIATGQYVHQHEYWESSLAYDGRIPSWMRRLRDRGHEVTAIGRLHFRSTEDDNGFSEEILPMHITEGVGDLVGLLRCSGEEVRDGIWDRYVLELGVGEHNPDQEYDRQITTEAVRWLKRHAKQTGKPWVLCVHYTSCHPPYTIPQRLYDIYAPGDSPLPGYTHPVERPEHPALQHYRKVLRYKDGVDEALMRKIAACYFGLVTHLDEQVGQVLQTLEETGLNASTRVIYSSDHGSSHGHNYIVHTSFHYDPSCAVPLLMAGPGIPSGKTVKQVTSHVDLFPTIVEALGEAPAEEDMALPGISLWPALHGRETERLGFSEYHGMGSRSASFMLRDGRYKLIYYVDMPPQLFDLETDPGESVDLAADGGSREKVSELEAKLRSIVDPEDANDLAIAAQRRRVEELGGTQAILEKRRGFVFSPRHGADWREG